MRYVAYDQYPLYATDGRELAANRFYRVQMGRPIAYYSPDDLRDQIVLYPRPSSITWQDLVDSLGFDDAGGLDGILEDQTDARDAGRTTEAYSGAGALLVIYEPIPQTLDSWADGEIDWPEWAWKYVMMGTLERAFGADTDGNIPSLRDYWKGRKEIGIQGLLRFKRMSRADRDYRLGGKRKSAVSSTLQLPYGYPAV